MSYRNLTPHRITVVSDDLPPVQLPDGSEYRPDSWSIEPELVPARVEMESIPAGYHAGIPLARPVLGEVTGLPEPEEGVLLIVSLMVQRAAPHRPDLVVPGDLIRDEQGRPIGCQRLHVAHVRCRRCGDVQDPATGHGMHDGDTPGGEGLCGDLHDWSAGS